MSIIKDKLLEHISRSYPDLVNNTVRDLLSDRLISPFHLSMPETILKQAQLIAKTINCLKCSTDYLNQIHSTASEQQKEFLNLPKQNNAIFSSFDFHVTDTNQLKLIEINTNAAFGGLGPFLYQAQGLKSIDENFHVLTVKEMILKELQLFGNNKNVNIKIAIIDENPEKQKLYLEFLLFQKIFQSYGWSCEILNSLNMTLEQISRFDFIYNRTTDFYFEKSEHTALRKAYLERSVCISPHPYEYLLLADKNRLSLFPDLDILSPIKEYLLKTIPINSENQAQIWTDRKNLFFKPSNEYGSKKSFRGGTISRRLFESIASEQLMAQEYVSAPIATFEFNGQSIEFKYDLRFYFYEDRIQFVVARLYQGQVTNAQTENGGFAPVIFQ